MAYDSVRGTGVLFGGSDSSGYRDDTWQWDGANWTKLQPTANPPARSSFRMIYDSTNQSTDCFGGYSAGYLRDTWVHASGHPASANAYGSGCSNPPFTFSPDANARPIIGQVAMATITTLSAIASTGPSETSEWHRSNATSIAYR
ncbi:MAG: hypothetical protein ACI91B_003476 [Planctomycetota bacterium]|jgi:hypothetical protein